MFELIENYSKNAVIKVMGVGGGGGNAVQSMLESKIHGAEFIVVNTDAQALTDIKGATTVQLGAEITKGLGAGADPEIGKQAAEEDKDKIRDAIMDTDMLFIAAGMGGGTGTGAAPVIARCAHDMGILTVAVVTKPFDWEGTERKKYADDGINKLEDWVDSLIVLPNSKLEEVFGGDASIFDSFENANSALRGAVKGIAEIITIRGLINVDFADVKTVMSGKGKAMMGSGVARGENRSEEAVQFALSSPLLESIDLHGASGVLVNITAGEDLSVNEYNSIGATIKQIAADDATIITGCIKEEDTSGELRVTIIATGFDEGTDSDSQESSSSDAIELKNQVEPLRSGPGQQAMFENDSPHLSTEDTERKDEDDLDIPAFLRQQAD